MPQGVLIHYRADHRRYGFIKPDDGSQNVFVHRTSFPLGVRPETGMRLEYDVGADKRSGRLRATSVKVAPNPPE